jgi:hypothetical protein
VFVFEVVPGFNACMQAWLGEREYDEEDN